MLYHIFHLYLSVTLATIIMLSHKNTNSNQQLHKLHNKTVDITASVLSAPHGHKISKHVIVTTDKFTLLLKTDVILCLYSKNQNGVHSAS